MKRLVASLLSGPLVLLGMAFATPVLGNNFIDDHGAPSIDDILNELPAADEASALFDRYVELEQAFDPALADLYAEDASIVDRRTFPTGEVREITILVPQYKALVQQTMAVAKSTNDWNSYTEITFTREPDGVRLRATRLAHLKGYSSRFSLLLAPDNAGTWRVTEQLSESQP